MNLFILSCGGTQQKTSDASFKQVKATDIPVYNFSELEPILYSKSDTTYVVNFWATWCKPCVAELPSFEAYHEKNKQSKVKVILVSLDFPKQIEKKLVPFINDRKLEPDVVVLNDPDANSWIDKVSTEWSGSIPATIVFKGDKRGFFEQSFESLEELEEVVHGVVD